MLSVDIKVLAPQALSHVPMLGVSGRDENQFIDLQRANLSVRSLILKQFIDYCAAGVVLVLLSWFLLLIAAVIRLESKGPALFKQRRHGLNNKEFYIYKFRTMRAETEADGFRQAQRNDLRVTKFGRFLRRTSLDELPQFINVLKGEMSVVGPRPFPVELNHQYEATLHMYNRRHSVKPGITGWAQINDQRGPLTTPDGMGMRLNYDLHYINNWTIWLDLKIIAATPLLGLIHRNAI